jgi:hypothetical protein
MRRHVPSRYLRQTKTDRLLIDRQRIAAEERLDRKYLFTTGDPSLSAADVALGSKHRGRAFIPLPHGQTLMLRPVFHRADERSAPTRWSAANSPRPPN